MENPLPQSHMGECTLFDFYILVQVLEQLNLSCSCKSFEFLSFLIFSCGVVKLAILSLKVDTE